MFYVVQTLIVCGQCTLIIIKCQLCRSNSIMLVFDNIKFITYLGSYVKMVEYNLTN